MKRFFPLFLVGLAIFFFFIQTAKRCDNIHCIQFKDSGFFKEQEVYENTDKTYRALMTNGKIQIRIETYSEVNAKEAENFTQIKKMKMQGLFENARSPYPGMISSEIECNKKFLPTFKELSGEGMNIEYMRGFLNERLQYGSCLDSEVKLIGHSALFYCQDQRKWYQFEIIVPSNEDKDASYMGILKSIRCAR